MKAEPAVLSEKGKQICEIKVNEINFMKKFGFTEYIQAGIQLNLITCIDFTASNGHPKF